ncbi:ATP-dependent DNA helicase PcrA [bacterium]|nr:ATP-dependent DNA helicase PcrA [bacterium]
MNYLDSLNQEQKLAASTTEGPLLILAGAGSGKTRVITHRIVHLIHEGVSPDNILAVTFTNKAATEMRDRVTKLIKQHHASQRTSIDCLPTVTTFHSLGVKILKENHSVLNLPRHFTIYDRSDSLKAVKQALEKNDFNPKEFEPRKILNQISKAKGDAKNHQKYTEEVSSFFEEVVSKTWKSYEAILKDSHSLDFDDLLLKTLHLLEDYPLIREMYRKRWAYVHIDEYQDTNKVQYEIVRHITGKRKNICVVADVDQNIYSWRGADIQNVLRFETHFPGAQTILLEQNYRSTQNIISASNDIIKKNKNRVEKNVFTLNAEGQKITLYSAMNGFDEAEYIALTAQELIGSEAAPADIAVLFRTNFQSRALEEAFLKHNVPYQVLGTKFFERKEVKDVLSFLRLALNENTTADLMRVVNVPPRGIGKITALKLLENKRSELTGAIQEKVDRFYSILSDIRDEANTKPVSETIKFIIKRTGIETDLKKSGTEDDVARLENLRELVSLAVRFDELAPEEGVEQFLENAALQSDQDEIKNKEEKDAVRLMTVHASKGLEFPYVFVSGLEEGLFPHERLDDHGVDHEEERRLFYVALTRAEKKVYLTYAHMRTIFGSQKINLPSSFLDDIDTEYVEVIDSGNSAGASGYETTIFLD